MKVVGVRLLSHNSARNYTGVTSTEIMNCPVASVRQEEIINSKGPTGVWH